MSDVGHGPAHSRHGSGGEHEHGHNHSHEARTGGLAKDPVCGMSVDPTSAQHSANFAGKTYYFCSAGCRANFLAEPRRYVA